MSKQQHTQEPVADAELKIYQQRIDELKGFKLPCDINFVNGKVGKGCSLYTLQLRILNHGEALRQATRIAEKQRDTLLEALNEINNWLVCACIATPEDMAQSFQHMQQVADAAIDSVKGGAV